MSRRYDPVSNLDPKAIPAKKAKKEAMPPKGGHRFFYGLAYDRRDFVTLMVFTADG